MSPVVVCRRQDRYELIDGFKRLGAVRGLAQILRLSARLMEADERQAKAAIYGLNRAGGRTRGLEEGFVQGYNAQAAVEPGLGLIVGQLVTQAANDKEQLSIDL